MAETQDARAPRRDAVRNRARLVAAAAQAFRDDGLGASVNAIADRAGLNVATLYRHFPTKSDLIVAVLEAVLEPLVAARDRALTVAAADGALATFLREAVRLQAEHRGLVDALARDPARSDVRETLRQPAIEIVTPIVERAHQDGELRRDFDALDVLIALRMLVVASEAQPPLGARADRLVDMVLRGLRPQ
jgi:AcrR family transcriptional regulator